MKYKVYCDESRQTSYEYKLMGGIWIPSELGWEFVNEFHGWCLDNTGCLPAHMKWTRVPNNINDKYFSQYKKLVDLYFEYNQRYNGNIFFKTIIADSNYKFDHVIYNHGDPEEGFYKLYYHLIFSTLQISNEYHIRLAKRNVSEKKINKNEEERLYELQKCLNNGVCKKNNYSLIDNLVLTIEPRLARDRRLIQLSDILMGAVGYHWNGLHLRSDAKKSKVYLAEYIANKVGRKDLCFETNSLDRKFNIFRFRPNN